MDKEERCNILTCDDCINSNLLIDGKCGHCCRFLLKLEKKKEKYLNYLHRTLWSLRDEITWIENRIKYIEKGGELSDSDSDSDNLIGARRYYVGSSDED